MIRNVYQIGMLLVTLFVVNLIVSYSQTPPPPPPPLIWKAPDSNEIKKYPNNTHRFSVEFAGEIEVSENGGVLSHYVAKRAGSLSYVRVIHFTEEDLKKVSNEAILQEVKDTYSTTDGYKIVGEVKAEPKSIEFSASNKYKFRRIRAMLASGKLYELYIDVTNWHILQDYHKDKVEAFNFEANRFFSSFKLLK